ncbi:hypothetical protein H4R24_000394 [Coemansia sp. RSA 988]|nr:hypothetical protein H4R24_000394 [Coemansia sp. RSA 988]
MAYLCPPGEGWGPLSPERPVDFTPCFQYGFLATCLNFMFLVAAAMRLRRLRAASLLPFDLVGNPLFWGKLTMAAFALLASVSGLIAITSYHPTFSIYTISLVLQFAATAAAFYLHYKEQFYSRTASTSLLLFWLGSALLLSMRLRTSIALGYIDNHLVLVATDILFGLAAVANIILESKPKPEKLYELSSNTGYALLENHEDNAASTSFQSPEERANIFSLIGFTWMTALLEKGYRKPLQMEDTWKLSRHYQPDAVSEKFQRNWQAELDSGNPSLFWATVRTYGLSWALSSFYALARDVIAFTTPVLLSRLINFVSVYNTVEAEPIENGYFYAITIFILSNVQSLAYHHCHLQCQRLYSQMRIGYMAAIYRKTMNISNDARRQYGTGTIVNHMSVDAEHYVNFVANLSFELWSLPLQIVVVLCLLYRTLGWTMIAGVLTLLASIPISARILQSMNVLTEQLMGHRDRRMRIMDEVLSGIKAIKLYAWEQPFIQRINKVRIGMELRIIRKNSVLNAIESFVLPFTHFTVSFATFGLYALMDNVSRGPLTPQLAFVSLVLFNMLKYPIWCLPELIPKYVKSNVSHRRIFEFLNADEIDFTAIDRQPYDRDSPTTSPDDVLVSVKDGTFKWLSDDKAASSNINIKCRREELVAVIGRVGSGKSSLISAILGDMIKCSGDVTVCGSVAYVAQQPWILNATLRNNILFGSSYEEEYYNRVIDACALRQDLDNLPAGDLTEIGERGINLSGGQKMRVSLARAVYSRADVYVLDDPLAAVDAHVSKHLFTHVLGPQGMLQSQARILVTNAVQYLYNVDNIVMLSDGKIIEQGSYAQAMDKGGAIFEFASKLNDSNLNSTSNSSASSLAPNADNSANTSNNVDLHQKLDKQSELTSCCEGANSSVTGDIYRTTTIETKQDGRVEWSTYHMYAKACGKHNVLILLLALLLSSIGDVLTNIWLERWSTAGSKSNSADNSGQPDASHSTKYYLLIYGGLGLASALASSLKSLVLWLKCSIRASTKLHQNMLIGVLRSPMSFFDVTPLGRIINRFSSDLDVCDEKLPESFDELSHTIADTLSGIIIVTFTMPKIIFVLVVVILIYRRIQQLYLQSSRELKRIVAITTSPVFAHFQESISGMSTIRAYVQQPQFIAENEARLADNVRASYTIENSMTHLERIAEYSNILPEASDIIDDCRPKEAWPEHGVVEFKNYSTRYRDGLDLVLKDLSFRVLPRHKVGIVGRTGAGKSSLTLALFRIIEGFSGQILLDGEDISKYGLFDVRSKLSIIPQDPVLFEGTVRENLDPFGSYSDQNIWRALEQAHLADYIRTKQESLEFMVAQSGENFSVGQRQLICLARALLKHAKVLVLDEATAAIDNETDEIIQQTIKKEFKDCTVLTIAHRLNTIIDSDMILVVDGGRLAEYDTPQNLLANKESIFAKLVEEAQNSSTRV